MPPERASLVASEPGGAESSPCLSGVQGRHQGGKGPSASGTAVEATTPVRHWR